MTPQGGRHGGTTHCMDLDFLLEEGAPTQFSGNRNLAITRMNTEECKGTTKQVAFNSAETATTVQNI